MARLAGHPGNFLGGNGSGLGPGNQLHQDPTMPQVWLDPRRHSPDNIRASLRAIQNGHATTNRGLLRKFPSSLFLCWPHASFWATACCLLPGERKTIFPFRWAAGAAQRPPDRQR